MDHQVMKPQYAGIAQRLFLDMLHKRRVGRRSDDGVQCVPHKAEPAVQNERRNAKAHHAVQPVKAGEMGDDRGDKHCRGGDDVIAGVRRGGQQRFGLDDAANRLVETAYPQLDGDGGKQHCHSEPAKQHTGGMENF